MAAAAAHPELELHALLALHRGVGVHEQYWPPYESDDRPLVYSVSKTFTATAVGLAIAEGLLALDDRLVDLLGDESDAGAQRGSGSFARSGSGSPGGAEVVAVPEERAGRASRRAADRVAEITVHHLLSMSTGHTVDTIEALAELPPESWVSGFLQLEPQQPVGSCHVYNNGATFMLGELVRRRTGQDLLDYLRPRLFEPLGIDPTWDRDPLDRCLGYSGLHIDVRGLAAMGELLRCDGVWQGRRLLPEGWVARATVRQIPTTDENPEWSLGYGYQVWMGREGFRLDGAFGQFAFVLPERDLVVAIQSAQSCNQVLIDLLWEHLDDDRLVERVETGVSTRSTTRNALPEAPAVPIPPDSGLGAGWRSAGPIPLDPTMVPDGEEVGPAADVADLRVARTAGGFEVTMTAEGHPVLLVAVPGRWRRQVLQLGDAAVPVAVAAGADASGQLHLRLVFTETPHTLRLRVADGSARQAWKVIPLQGPDLASMRAH